MEHAIVLRFEMDEKYHLTGVVIQENTTNVPNGLPLIEEICNHVAKIIRDNKDIDDLEKTLNEKS